MLAPKFKIIITSAIVVIYSRLCLGFNLHNKEVLIKIDAGKKFILKLKAIKDMAPSIQESSLSFLLVRLLQLIYLSIAKTKLICNRIKPHI